MTVITPEIVSQHGLNNEEYGRIQELIGREPNLVELGIFSAMWNEHCSYKSSKKWLKTLHVSGPQVICGPGENAGVVDIGDGMAAVFKMESHNHPSFIEPYQGAATGVGGILRDVFTMGARPIAALNALFFGAVDHELTRKLVNGVVAGVGGYGNAFGVPTVGGSVTFDERYNTNILVNAMAVGLVESNQVFYSAASEIGRQVVYIGAKTGRDGIHGATMASAAFGEDSAELRPTVQVGDPFCEKRLLEATLELMASGCVDSIQDMGAAGLTCSAVEMGAKGNMGVRLDLDRVPQRETAMTAYEMMLSESQERMLLILSPGREEDAKAILDKWDLDFAIVGETISETQFRIFHHGEEVANLPIRELGDEAPEYDRPYSSPPSFPEFDGSGLDDMTQASALLKLLGHPNHASRAPIFEQYDHLVGGETVLRPAQGDAAVVALPGQDKGLAMTTDVNPRYCLLDPYRGAMQAVAETYRNLCAVGATPLAITDNLNFGNPQRPEIMAQFVEAIKGIDAACRALDYPVVSGNVSLYNETDGRGIPPTPTIGGLGLVADVDKALGLATKHNPEGLVVVLLGQQGTHLGGSALVADVLGRIEGPAPMTDLSLERQHGAFVLEAQQAGHLSACHDISDGGMLMALAELCLGNGMGFAFEDHDWDMTGLFGEDQSRYLLVMAPDKLDVARNLATAHKVNCQVIGHFAGQMLQMPDGSSLSLDEMANTNKSGFDSLLKDN